MKEDLKVFLASVIGIPLFLAGSSAFVAADAASVVVVEKEPMALIPQQPLVREEPAEKPVPKEVQPTAPKPVPAAPAPAAPPPAPVVIAETPPPAVPEPAPVKKEKKSRRTRAS